MHLTKKALITFSLVQTTSFTLSSIQQQLWHNRVALNLFYLTILILS